MAIGATPSSAYTRAGAVGTLNGTAGTQVGASLKFFLITVKDNSNSAIDLRPEDDATNEAFEAVIRALPQGVLAYFAANAGTGVISVIVDGVNAPGATELRDNIRALGASVGGNGIDVRGTTVTEGTSFTVA